MKSPLKKNLVRKALFSRFKKAFEIALQEAVLDMGEKSPLRDACEYALQSGGKRFRPVLVYSIADALGRQRDVKRAALAVEFFHAASLIADDLPCMDDEAERRQKPTIHRVFGEATALLASYALIAYGYEMLYRAERELAASGEKGSAEICVLALGCMSRCAGLRGAVHGQYMDLFPPDKNAKTVLRIIYEKTGTLFEVAFVLGWLFGGGDIERLDLVRKAAGHFGLAFQIADDFQDVRQDDENRSFGNMVIALGAAEARACFRAEVAAFGEALLSLNLKSQNFEQMVAGLKELAGVS